jgi:MoxR-like ATPase
MSGEYSYTKTFDPSSGVLPATSTALKSEVLGDRRDGLVYVYTPEIILAVNVAIATGRPLLLRGPSGSGKSSLARNIALRMGWRYYEDVISSSTQARDLLWRFDAVRRLSDAQVKSLQEGLTPYVEPGVLWWAFDRDSARRRGLCSNVQQSFASAEDPGAEGECLKAVVLLDEIDKADPDVPNNLLVPLGSLRFTIPETGTEVIAKEAPLVVITTNDERELPGAFLRRCVVLTLDEPDIDRLTAIAQAHFPDGNEETYRSLAEAVQQMKQARDRQAANHKVNAAEYLDALTACQKLKAEPGSDAWKAILRVTLRKDMEAARTER